ncbi:MAG: tetratricopeptide repeat protein [Burkholderiales bacterium]|nr:tetratricopeptide repeat protein [Burkholderiales bacterium]
MPLRAVRLFAPVVALLVAFSFIAPAAAQSDELQEANQAFKLGQFDRALDRVNAHLAKNPKEARGRFLKGIILTEQGKPADAIRIFTDLTQDYPELPEPYNNLAVLYASQGQYEKARVALEMAIRTHPSYATAHENLGDIYAKMASQAYDKALQLDKTNTTAQTKLNLIKDILPAGRPSRPAAKVDAPVKVAAAGKPAAQPAAHPAPAPKAPDATVSAKDKPPAAKAPAPAEVASARKEPPTEPAKSAPGKGDPGEVLKALNDWARAWSGNDVEGYLAHYAPDFRTPKGESRGDWEAQRRARIAKPRRIEVAVESPKVAFNEAGRVTVTFRQRYESGQLKVTSTKTMVLVRAGGRWLIQQERIGS